MNTHPLYKYFMDARFHIRTLMAEHALPAPAAGGGVERPVVGWA
jgi:hypothetical protein